MDPSYVSTMALTQRSTRSIRFFNVVERVADNADAEQVSNPLGIFRIILIPFHGLDPFRVGDDDTDAPLFQDI